LNIGGEIIGIDKATLATLLQGIRAIQENDLLKQPAAKKMLDSAKEALVIILKKMEVMKKERAYVRLAISPEATHSSYFECVSIPRDGKKTITEALTEALNVVLYQSKETADVSLVFTKEGDTHFEFVISIKQ